MIPFMELRSVRAYPRVHLQLTGQWEWHSCREGMVFVKWRSGGFGSCLGSCLSAFIFNPTLGMNSALSPICAGGFLLSVSCVN